jgi:hypothetical protein
MKNFKYTSIFSSTVKPIVSEDKDKYLSLASMVDLEKFIPEVDAEKEVDLLPIAFNAFVANRVNKNGDVIDTGTSLAVYKSFINKPMNVEHNRDRVIGTILTAGFSEFGTDKPLTEEDVAEISGPFNVTLGGVVWRVVNPELADFIEDSADPTSNNYMNVSASWELGFTDYEIIAIRGDEKNIENAEVIAGEDDVEEFKENLKAFGGEGKLEDGRKIYRKVVNDVLPLGIGLTETPAADVEGLSAKITFEALNKEIKEIREAKDDEEKEPVTQKEETISQVVEKDVNQNNKGRNMKLNSINDITEESLKELSASVVSDFIEEQLKEASEKFNEEKTETETALKAAKEEYDKLSTDHGELKEQLEKLSNSIAELENEKNERVALDKFNERMSVLDEAYELDDEDRKVIAAQIKNLNDEAFEAYSNDMKVLLSSKNKELLAEKEEVVEVEETKASIDEPAVEEVVENALDNAEETTEEIPVSATASDDTVYDKYRAAFDMGNWTFQNKR